MTMAILICAAGNSSRLGQPKQLITRQGSPLLQRCIDLCVSLGPDVYCVLGAYARQIRQTVGSDYCHFLYNHSWQDGLSQTIAFGVSQLPASTTSVLIILADLWALDIDELENLIVKHGQSPEHIHCSLFNDRIGPPTIFPKYCFDALKQMPAGGNGAKAVLNQFNHKVKTVPLPSAAFDLDTQQQLQQLISMEIADDIPDH